MRGLFEFIPRSICSGFDSFGAKRAKDLEELNRRLTSLSNLQICRINLDKMLALVFQIEQYCFQFEHEYES